jgi:KTSC domain
MHPGLQPAEEVEGFTEKGMQDLKGMQGPTPVQLPGDQWTQWEVTPSYGGRSGRRMSDAARYNQEAGQLDVRFASGGRGVPSTYRYSGITPEVWRDFMSGRLNYNRTATAFWLTSHGGVRIS